MRTTSSPPRSLASTAAAISAVFWIMAALNVQLPMLPAYAAAGGWSTMALTAGFAFYVIFIVPMTLALAGLPDRIGYRAMLVLSVAAMLLATASMVVWPSFEGFLVGRVFHGLGGSLALGAATAYIALSAPGAQPVRFAAIGVGVTSSLGLGVAPLATALVLPPGVTPPLTYHIQIAGCAATIAWLLLMPSGAAPPGPSSDCPMSRKEHGAR